MRLMSVINFARAMNTPKNIQNGGNESLLTISLFNREMNKNTKVVEITRIKKTLNI
jgi:hypothetical protein